MRIDLGDDILGGTADRCLENDGRLVGRDVVYADKKHRRVAVWTDVRQKKTFALLPATQH